MAIIVKVEGDTKQLDDALDKSAQKARTAFDRTGLGDSVKREVNKAQDAFTQINNTLGSFKARLSSALDPAALRGFVQHIGGVAQGGEQAAKSLVLMAQSSGLALTALAGLGVGLAAATGQVISMALEGAKLADEMGKTAAATGKTFEEIQKLEKGGRDLTPRLKELGAILSGDVIQQASRATDAFSVLGEQFNAIKEQMAAKTEPGFNSLGRTIQQLLKDATPAFEQLASVVSDVMTRISGEVNKAKADIAGLIGIAIKVGTFITGGALDNNLERLQGFGLNEEPPDPNRLAFSRSNEALRKLIAPEFTSPNARPGRTGGGRRGSARSAVEQPPDLPQEAKEALDRIDFAFELMGKNLNQLADLQARNTKDLEEARTKQLELEQRNQQATKEYIALREQTVKLENRNLELLGAKLTAIEQGGTFNVKLALGPKPGLEGPSLFVPGISQAQAQAPILQANEEARIAANNQRLLDELIDQYENFRNRVGDVLFQAFDDGFRRGPGNFFTRTLASLRDTIARIALSNLADRIASAISPALFGALGRGGATGGGGGFNINLGAGGGGASGGGFGGLLRGIISGNGGGGFGGFLTPPFNPNAGSQIAIPGSVSAGQSPVGLLNLGGVFGGTQIPGLGGGGAAAGGFSLGGLLGGLAPTFPLLGAGLGSALGGSSVPGKILGGIGGGILGATSAILATGSLFGLSIGLLTNPFTAIAGIGLLVGSALFGRAAQRKKDEKAADEIWVNEMNQIRQLISQVNSDRIDGQEALALAAQLRQQTIAGLNQIKTKSVRESRLTNQLRDLDNGVVAELKRAVERQATRQRIGPQLVPEFATGGRVPGIDQGFDSVIARLRPGEAVLNQSQIALLGGVSALRRARVPGFAEGGQITASTPSGGSNAGGPMTIIFEDVTIDAEGIFVKGARTSKGERVAVQIQRNARKNGRA